MSVRDEILRANDEFAREFDRGHLRPPPARRFAVVTCMDARIDPASLLGIAPGDAVSRAASMIAWICSMLFTLNAPTP